MVTLTVDVPVLVPVDPSTTTQAEARAEAQRIALQQAAPPAGLKWDSADVEIVTKHRWLPPEDERPEPPEWAWVRLPGVPGRWASNVAVAIREDGPRPLYIPAGWPWRRPLDAMTSALSRHMACASERPDDGVVIDAAYRTILAASDGVVQVGAALACLRAGDDAPHALVMPFDRRPEGHDDYIAALACLDRTGWPDPTEAA